MEENGKTLLTTRILIFDVAIPSIKLGLLIWSVVSLFNNGNPWWAWSTIAAILTPGILEVLYWLTVCCCDPEKRTTREPWQWILFFNPIFFPFTTILKHALIICDLSHFDEFFPMALVLNSLQSFTEAAAITVLQLVIIITTWNDAEGPEDPIAGAINSFGNLDGRQVTRYVQVVSTVLAVVGLAKDYARHHFFELSGKERIPPFWKSLKALAFYVVHIACRLPSLVLLALFFRHYFFLILLFLVFFNFALSVCLLGHNISKSLWTSFSAVLAPTCFVARAEVPTLPHPGRAFFRYYVANTFAFLAVSLSAHILADIYYGLGEGNAGINRDIYNFLEESFSRIPFLDMDCSPHYSGCPYVLSSIGISFAIAEFIVLKIKQACFPDFMGTNLPILNAA